MNRKYIVPLNKEERSQLQQIIASGTAPARKIRRAQIPLKSDSSPRGPTGVIRRSVPPLTSRHRRIPDQATLLREAQAWADERNPKAIGVDGRFTAADARIKLKRLYPKIQD